MNNTDFLSFDEHLQEVVVLWEVKAVAVLIGGFFAGAGTANGLKQGLVSGIFTGAIVNVTLVYRGTSLDVVALSLAVAFCLALAGGWFGGQLFPPLGRKRLNGIGPATL